MPGRRSPLRGNGKHDDAKPEHRQSHEFKYQRVKHGNSPSQTVRLVGKRIDRFLIPGRAGASAAGECLMEG